MIKSEPLPKGMQKKHGSYYYVSPAHKWVRLGRNLGDACMRMAAIKSGTAEILPPPDKAKARDWLTDSFRILISNSRGRAKKQNLEHTLTLDELREIAERGRYCCAVTGLMFSNEKWKQSDTRPFFPSIDRIDSSKGYIKGNCRLVSVAANYAMNAWGIEVFTKIAAAHLSKLRKEGRQST